MAEKNGRQNGLSVPHPLYGRTFYLYYIGRARRPLFYFYSGKARRPLFYFYSGKSVSPCAFV